MTEPGKIYVGNLDFTIDEEELREEFEEFGDIEDVIVIKDRETGRSKGFGFVTFRKTKDAETAVKRKDKIGDRHLRVNFAKPRRQRYSGGGRYSSDRSYGGGGGGNQYDEDYDSDHGGSGRCQYSDRD